MKVALALGIILSHLRGGGGGGGGELCYSVKKAHLAWQTELDRCNVSVSSRILLNSMLGWYNVATKL